MNGSSGPAAPTGDGAEVAGAVHGSALLEWYRYPPGPAVELPRHSHEEYQLNLNLGLPGGVHYRGAYHVVPADRLAVIMPGEPHTPRDCTDRDAVSGHLVLYLPTATVAGTAREAGGGSRGTPFFRHLVIDDLRLIRSFAAAHQVLAGAGPALEKDVRLVQLLARLVRRHADATSPRSLPAAHASVRRARDYLHDNAASNVTLDELAAASDLSPYHLTRLFSETVGLPPHTYHLRRRLDRAKRLLLAGGTVTEAAHGSGFYDLSHFTRHFRRYVGATPSAYARGGTR